MSSHYIEAALRDTWTVRYDDLNGKSHVAATYSDDPASSDYVAGGARSAAVAYIAEYDALMSSLFDKAMTVARKGK